VRRNLVERGGVICLMLLVLRPGCGPGLGPVQPDRCAGAGVNARNYQRLCGKLPAELLDKQPVKPEHPVMKRIAWLSLSGLMAASLTAAEPGAKDVIKSAAKALGDKPNYSWSMTSKPEGDDTRFTFSAEGKTEKEGCAVFAFTFGDTPVDVVVKGAKVAVKREGEWKTPDELEGNQAWMARRIELFKVPAAEVDDLLGKAKDLKAGEGGLYSGDLTAEGVKEMFGRWRRGGQGPEAKDTKGWVKFWIKGGALTKYQFNTQGRITIGQDQQEMEINRTTTVEIKDVGTTKLSVPEEAKKKLS